MKKIQYIILALSAAFLTVSCGKAFLESNDTSYLTADEVGEVAAEDPDGFLNGMWAHLVDMYNSSHDTFGHMSVLLSTDMTGVDMLYDNAHWFSFDYQFDNRMNNYRRTAVNWWCYYTLIAKANEIIGLYPNGPETDSAKALLGQALAMRAFAYYYLVQLYQFPVTSTGEVNNDAPAVPIIYTTADGLSMEEIESYKGRNTVKDVYKVIETDLEKAIEYLAGYERPTKVYVDQSVAYGIQARYYLLSQQWEKAAAAAKSARANYPIMDNDGLHDGFMNIGNAEWMWGFKHTSETNTTYASFFSQIANLAPGYAGLDYSAKLIDANLYSLIPDDDYRKTLFNGPDGDSSQPTSGAKVPYANLKYGDTGDWCMDYLYMRASEMVLIEAEALAQQGKNAEAAGVLKELMAKRQPSWNKSSVTVEDIYLQRRIELWGEGFSYFDLKRLNKGIDRAYAGSNHDPSYLLKVPAQDERWCYQIPLSEINENTHISESDQNK